jgi:hypothetical protein
VARERFAVQLSQNLFTEITGVDLSALTSDPQADRRLHRRIAFDHRARIFPIIEGAGVAGAAVLLRNISVGGVCFLYGEPMSVGDEFVIRMATAKDETIDIQAAARHCEMGGTCGSQFVVGASFELVLNRPLSSSVAPESEMGDDNETLQDQPAEPTIEQRYDTQCVASRAIRPMIRETRWDRWLAKPAVKKLSRVISLVFWPMIVVCKGINRILKASEESRIRNRLSPSQSSKKWKRKGKSEKPFAPPSMMEPAPSAIAKLEVAASGVGSGQMPAQAEASASMSAPAILPSGRKSLFDSGAPEQVVAPTVEKPVAQISPQIPALPTAPVVAPVVAQIVAEPRPAEPVAPAQPVVTRPTMEVPAEAAPSAPAEPMAQATPAHSIAPKAPESEPMVMVDQPRTTTTSTKVRPPVAHPRQMRRRQRETFHR